MSDIDLSQIITGRYSCRYFQNKPVPKQTVEQAINWAKTAPSSKNTQPWKVKVAGGKTLQNLSQDLLEFAKKGEKPKPDYQHSPNPLPDLHMDRARKCGYGIFELKGITRDDKAARMEHNLENHRFFHAPQAMFLYLEIPPQGTTKGSYLDCGMFLQNLLLSLRILGLEGCAQYSVACYPELVRKHLQIPEKTEIICSLSFGFADNEKLVNSYRTERAPLEEFADFIDIE